MMLNAMPAFRDKPARLSNRCGTARSYKKSRFSLASWYLSRWLTQTKYLPMKKGSKSPVLLQSTEPVSND